MNTRTPFRMDGAPHTRIRYSSRREFLQRAGGGFGLVGLAGLLQQSGLLAGDGAETSAGPLQPRVRRAGHGWPLRHEARIMLRRNQTPPVRYESNATWPIDRVRTAPRSLKGPLV